MCLKSLAAPTVDIGASSLLSRILDGCSTFQVRMSTCEDQNHNEKSHLKLPEILNPSFSFPAAFYKITLLPELLVCSSKKLLTVRVEVECTLFCIGLPFAGPPHRWDRKGQLSESSDSFHLCYKSTVIQYWVWWEENCVWSLKWSWLPIRDFESFIHFSGVSDSFCMKFFPWKYDCVKSCRLLSLYDALMKKVHCDFNIHMGNLGSVSTSTNS